MFRQEINQNNREDMLNKDESAHEIEESVLLGRGTGVELVKNILSNCNRVNVAPKGKFRQWRMRYMNKQPIAKRR